MLLTDLPPQLHERVVCSISAAAKFRIPANILLAIAEKENGRPGQWVKNPNGSFDIGSLQFNSKYISELSAYGIGFADVAAKGCYPYELAAWRLKKHFQNDKGDLWTRAANYHSKTYRFNRIYRADLIVKSVKWAQWLERNSHHNTALYKPSE